jgi:O-antigen/teichoic acid export membrane protein
MSRFQRWKTFSEPKVHRVIEFLRSQGITMAGNLFYGFLCVRLLTIADYAKYAVVFGFLNTLLVLMDVGCSGALLPLIGERIDDRRLIADYVASLRQIAHWLYLLIGPVAVIVYPLIVHRQHWAWQVIAGMIAILLVAAWFARVSGAYGAVLIVRRDRKSWYRIQMTSSLGTLALLGVAWTAHLLTVFWAISINVAGMAYVASAYFLQARRLLGVKGVASRAKRTAIIHFAAPNLPNMIFYAFQGQISLFLIAFFGRGTAVAGLGALSRLGQIFVLFAQMAPLLIEPYFARLPRARLKRNYLGLLVIEVLMCGVVTGLARFFPGPLLWILGPKYSALHYEAFLLIAASSLGYLYTVFWVVNNACRFVYWWNSFAIIILTLAIQVIFIWKADLSTIRGVLTMNLCALLGNFAVVVVTGIYGFTFGPRLEKTPAIDRETDYA